MRTRRLFMIAGKSIVDFGWPTKKIALEADGREFHDEERDRRRDQLLWERYGWRVFRVTGAECRRVRPLPSEFSEQYYEEHGRRPEPEELERAAWEYYGNTSEGVCNALRAIFVRRELDGPGFDLHYRTLVMHRLVDFPIPDDEQ